MRISTAVRHCREGFKNVARNGWMSFASVSSIAISLLILGLFGMLMLNVYYIAEQFEKQVEISVHLQSKIPKDQISSLQNEISSLPAVKMVKFVSKEEGLAKLRSRFGERQKNLLEDLDGDNNPLPDTFTVEVADPRNVGAVAERINSINNTRPNKPILNVDYGHETVDKLFKFTKIVRYVCYGLVAALSFTSMFLIANTIKLTIFARRREIAIMKLVGATNSFIRGPFFIEGALLGLIGSVIPAGILLYGYWQLMMSGELDQLAFMMLKLVPFEELAVPVGAILILVGVLMGVTGSTLSIRKHLRV